eukprot:RCo032891
MSQSHLWPGRLLRPSCQGAWDDHRCSTQTRRALRALALLWRSTCPCQTFHQGVFKDHHPKVKVEVEQNLQAPFYLGLPKMSRKLFLGLQLARVCLTATTMTEPMVCGRN